MERDRPADIRGAGYQDLALADLIDSAYVIYHADSSRDDACSTCKAFDVRVVRPFRSAAAYVIIVSSVRIFHPFIGIEPADDDAWEPRVGEISCKSLFACRDV